MKNTLVLTLAILAVASLAPAETILIDEGFEYPAFDGDRLDEVTVAGWTRGPDNSWGQAGPRSGYDLSGSYSLGRVNGDGGADNYTQAFTEYTLGTGEYFLLEYAARGKNDGDTGFEYYIDLEDGSNIVRMELIGDDSGRSFDATGSVTDGSSDATGSVDLSGEGDFGWGLMRAEIHSDETIFSGSSDAGSTWTTLGTVNAGLSKASALQLWIRVSSVQPSMDDVKLSVVPEPATMGLLGLGAFGLLRRNKK